MLWAAHQELLKFGFRMYKKDLPLPLDHADPSAKGQFISCSACRHHHAPYKLITCGERTLRAEGPRQKLPGLPIFRAVPQWRCHCLTSIPFLD
ncbi:hypothetical protein CC2G_007801 [Coprinopsis cinerea AmutBmut pab1-1]|nr:hypothetical protein CC2G_007801 [Coprinopsis cinerea AmutBmut pab1-1]